MNKFGILLLVCALASATASASWYWPFGGDDDAKKDLPRVSELMEPASVLIDSASDFAEDGKLSEAVDAYRRALEELDRIEYENADRAESAAFATLRNKRTYVNAAIDSLLLKQAQQNARAVAVTDTTELQKRFDAKKRQEKGLSDEKKMEIAEKTVAEREEQKVVENAPAGQAEQAKPAVSKARAAIVAELKNDPQNRRALLRLAALDMREGDYAASLLTIEGLLTDRPNDAVALNLRAAVEAEMGDFKKAERTLDQSIQSNPRSHYAYYNMARLFLRTRGDEGKASAKRYYETGRQFGGPVDTALEESLR